MTTLEKIYSLRALVNPPIRIIGTETVLIRREAIIAMTQHQLVAIEIVNVVIHVVMKKITKIKLKPMKVKTMEDFLNLLKILSKKLCPDEKLLENLKPCYSGMFSIFHRKIIRNSFYEYSNSTACDFE